MTASRRAGLTAALGVVGVLAALLVAAWGAAIGPGTVLRGEGPAQATVIMTPTESDSASGAQSAQDDIEPSEPRGGAFAAVVLALGVVALMVAPFIAVFLTKTVLEGVQWRRPDALPEESEFEDLVDALAEDLPEQEALLATGPVADGIIGCWQRFERLATDHGLPRRAAETSSEFVLRVLDRASSDGPAVTRLAGLYREARFSDHPLGEEHRAAALDAVRRIAAAFRIEDRSATGGAP